MFINMQIIIKLKMEKKRLKKLLKKEYLLQLVLSFDKNKVLILIVGKKIFIS